MSRSCSTFVIVSALALKHGTGANKFTYVNGMDWYYDYIRTAAEYKILKLDPNDKITRELAMTMVARAMNITGLKVQFAYGEMDKLLASFGDSAQSADYAINDIAACVRPELSQKGMAT